MQNCQWIRQTQEKKDKWCNKYNNGRSVHKACPMTCGDCCADDTEYNRRNVNGLRIKIGKTNGAIDIATEVLSEMNVVSNVESVVLTIPITLLKLMVKIDSVNGFQIKVGRTNGVIC